MKTDQSDRPYVIARIAKRRPRHLHVVIGLIVVLSIVAAYVWLYTPKYLPPYLVQFATPQNQRGQAGGQGGRFGLRGAPVPVFAVVAKKAEVPVYVEGVGSSRALNTVTVRAQVDGKLMSVNFKEGQDVDKGFVLAEIDATTYQAQYDQAVAKKRLDEAQLANARLDLERYTQLAQTNSATRQQYDTQRALVAQLEGQVQADRGAIDYAKAILSYTKIIAPLAGRTGIRQVDAGNIVHAADATGIVVITQIKPIAVIFALPQQQLARVNKALAQGPLSVQALGDDNLTVVDRGTLQVVDNQVDQTTATVKLKAEFPNADLQLWPGQFVNVKLLVDTLHNAIVVPSAAVQRGPSGTFAYVASDDSTVTVRPITVAQQDDTHAVIVSGVAEGERVVTSGFAQLSDNAKITIVTRESLEQPADSERIGSRSRGDGDLQTQQRPVGAAAQPTVAQPGAAAVQPSETPPSNAAQWRATDPIGAKSGEMPRPGTRRRTQAGGLATATP